MIKIMKSYVRNGENPVLSEVDGELKRCPFCGSEGVIYGDGDHYYTAACSECLVEIVNFYFTLEEAVAAWNTRADDD